MLRANYALLINEAEFALDFSNRAIELNSDLCDSYSFRALSNLILGKQKDFNSDIKRLKNDTSSDYHKAVAWGLLGDFQQMSALLHRSFVMGRVSPESVLQDICFRIYWESDEFKSSVLRFCKKAEKVETPYLETCLPSEKELELRKKIKF